MTKYDSNSRKMETSNQRVSENPHFSLWRSPWSAGLDLRARTKSRSLAISYRKKLRILQKNLAFKTFRHQMDGYIVSKPGIICAAKWFPARKEMWMSCRWNSGNAILCQTFSVAILTLKFTMQMKRDYSINSFRIELCIFVARNAPEESAPKIVFLSFFAQTEAEQTNWNP